MKATILFLCLGVWMATCAQPKTFPCNFNVYEEQQDGRITMEEFSKYTIKHGYEAKQIELAFSTLDSNADGQIEVSEFVANVGTLQKMSLLGHCKRFRITITISFGK